jgi:hypothetical protein
VACEGFDLTVDEIANLMGPSFNSLFGFVFEDFLAARFGEEGEINVVDDYLKRRGWREKVPAKRYLAALGESFASIFKVIEVDPGHSMTVVDLVLGGEPIVINE